MKKEKVIDWLAEGSVAIPKLLLKYYKSMGLNEEEFVMLLHVHSSIESGNAFPTPDELSERMSCSKEHCMEILQYLIQHSFLQIEGTSSIDGVLAECYTLRPLWEKLMHFLMELESKQVKHENKQTEINVYSMFEQEFGRPLSPMECESMTMWLDQENHSPLLIKTALREAVMSGKLNFRYIDRILFEWKKKGIETVEQARDQGMKFRSHQRANSQPVKQETTSIPFYNWLES
jgi:DNA replication protein